MPSDLSDSASRMGAAAITLVVVIMLLGLAAVIGGAFAGMAPDSTVDDSEYEDLETSQGIPQSGEYVTYHDGYVENVTEVTETRGNAVSFSGDGYADADGVGLDGQDWATSTQVWIDADRNETMNLLGVDAGSLIVQYDGPSDEFHAFYYNYTHSANVTVEATNATSRTTLAVSRYNDEFALSAWSVEGSDTYREASATLNASTAAPLEADSGLYGTVDETRLYESSDATLSIDTIHDDPSLGVSGATETARLMYDEGAGDTTQVHWAGTDAALVNATWADGVGSVDPTEGTDYQLSSNGIAAMNGGAFDNQAVAWIDYQGDYQSAGLFGILDMGVIGITLFSVGLLVIPAVAIIGYLWRSEAVRGAVRDGYR